MQIIHGLLDWWHQQSWIELIGVLTGFICVWLAAINNIWNWPIAIISVAIYIYVFYNYQLYADMGLQVYFLITSIYGWYFWSKKSVAEIKIPVTAINKKQIIISVIITLIVTPVLGYTLVSLSPILHYKPAAYPYLDCFCTTCSLIAQVYLTRKILENWLIWIFVDAIYVGVYIAKHLQPTAILYAAYIPVALLGYLDWRREYKKQLSL